MSTFSWASGSGGDWNTAGLWDVGAIPNSGTAVVAITQPGSYDVTIATGEIETVGTLSLASATLSVGGTLQFAAAAQPAISQGSGTVVVGAQGVIEGFGSFAPGTLINAGTIIASGGTLGSLILDSPITGAGTLSASSGSTLILAGGSADVLNAVGQVFNTGSLVITGSLTGGGTVVVENGGALEFGGATTADLSFAGSNVTVTLDSPSQYQGTLVGFGPGDTLVLDGVLGSAASVVNANTLAITTGGSTIDLALAGNYAGATFATRTVGGNTVVTNTAGAPARSDLSANIVSVTDHVGLSGSLLAAIENEVTFAADNLGQYLTGAAPLRVALTFVSSGAFSSELSTGTPGAFIANGETINGHAVFIPDGLYTLQTGDYAAGTSSDIAITLVASATNLSNFYINTDPSAGTTVPLGKIDLLSDLTQEFLHGIGIAGLINKFAPTAGSPPVVNGAQISPFDSFVTDATVNGTAVATFTGPSTEAAYGAAINAGTSVPLPLFLTTGSLSVDNFYHVKNTLGAPLQNDLLTTAFGTGTSFPISSIDLAMLQDIGAPVTAFVTCYVRGTLIRTPGGDVAVERLLVGEKVMTVSGVARPIVWVGHRSVDCRRHPHPDRVMPVRIAAHAFGPGQPRRDLFVSPNHAIYQDGVLIPVRLLINGLTVVQTERTSVDYFHVELDSHDILLAEDLPAESYLDCGDRHVFAIGGDVVTLVAEFAGNRWETAGYAPLILRGPELEEVRSALRSRAGGIIGNAFSAVAATA